jgi:hypothetical protein
MKEKISEAISGRERTRAELEDSRTRGKERRVK